MKVAKHTKLFAFFIISIIYLKLLIKLPKRIFFFFSLINRAKSPFKIQEHLLPPYVTLFWPKYSKITP